MKEKHPHCVPTHLSDNELSWIHEQASNRGWSHSQYIRNLVREDMQRHLSDLEYKVALHNIERERLERLKRLNRTQFEDDF